MRNLFNFSIVVLAIFMAACGSKKNTESEEAVEEIVIPEPVIEYGFNLDSFVVERDTVQPGWTMSHMFQGYGLTQYQINIAAEMAADSSVGLRYIKEGKDYLMLCDREDTAKKLLYCIYPKSIVEYVVFDFTTDSIIVEKREKEWSIEEKMISGEIIKNSNLTFALDQQLKDINMTGEMAEHIAGVFAWTIDFFRLHPGDEFKAIYTEKSVEGKPFSVGEIKYAWFRHQGLEYYGFKYVVNADSNKVGFFDEKGKEMKRPFLMAPVKYSRISSGFTMKRFHPVQKRWKSHLGTDYAAPHGTPIMATADGTVIAASYTGGNGNYVKIYHDEVYSTQYLHMSGFAPGIKKGVRVRQGQVIGYVGSTGLATGPHVCYRFWKNGKQVNHRAEKFPPSVPMPDSILPKYLEFIEPIKARLDSLPITPYVVESDSINV
ncbi:peptidoglycan DD-metalloendopeptidase family protein [Paracrocinitomix mangrovi]|uniref:M23 family metallopeptidase n=1 Tax=Paracrocinitomix mangrovi TaxID=2862509 RepID=UPI001C8EEDFE|nr:peptidoglycan DD-metalloendopeptidase family protein [Paracrocinitomix mangrovi]UKN00676.1 peptidoglycan DD-metalloendopeptidase family protein [Paracrocinitomix mangrovi]